MPDSEELLENDNGVLCEEKSERSVNGWYNFMHENGFLDDFTDNFMDYLENNRMKRLRKEEAYLEVENKINEIKDNNPKVRIFMDNKEKVNTCTI